MPERVIVGPANARQEPVTGGSAVTVIAAVPLFPSLVAVIVAAPTATPVTSPLPFTLAIPPLLDAHVSARPVRTVPALSLVTALSWTAWPAGTLAVAGLTATDATGAGAGGAVTVIAAVPLLPSLVAVIVAVPAATPVTRPLVFTVAAAGLLLAHAIVRPDNVLPFASFGVAVSCTVWPTATLAAAGLTATEATGTLDTVIAAVPLFPSLAAVIVAAPVLTPVTRPLADTVATPGLPLNQLTVRPLSRLPFASFGIAASCTVCPTDTLADAGLMLTDATGAGGGAAPVTAALPLFPSHVPVIVAEPEATPLTRPLPSTVATLAAPLVHVTARPPSAVPAESTGIATSSIVLSTITFAVPGATTTAPTGTTTGLTPAVALSDLPLARGLPPTLK